MAQVKSKVICTIGPKTQSPEMLTSLVDAGMNVMRLNFSHGDHAYHARTIRNLRHCLTGTGKQVAVLLDTKGPEIRTCRLKGGVDVRLSEGQLFTFYPSGPPGADERLGDENGVATTYPTLATSVQPGNTILVDDGLIGFTVLECHPDGTVVTRVQNNASLGERKGVNLPGVSVDLPAITEKDQADILFGVEQGVDFIAASFIRKADDVREIRKLLGKSGIQIISKIESQEGLDNFMDILSVSDGIMVARGDLGVEIPVEKVAAAQKMMIARCNYAGKPVVTATQMLESMIVNPRPTRAEATDVHNAVLDGTDCIMLSGETAKGAHPVAAVQMMVTIAREAESFVDYAELYPALRRRLQLPLKMSEAIACSAVKTSWDVHAALIICLTETGQTARSIAKYRPIAPVLAITASPQTARQIQVLRGVYAFLADSMEGTDMNVTRAMLYAVKQGWATKGDPVVLTSGVIEGVSGHTNIMRVIKCAGFEV